MSHLPNINWTEVWDLCKFRGKDCLEAFDTTFRTDTATESLSFVPVWSLYEWILMIGIPLVSAVIHFSAYDTGKRLPRQQFLWICVEAVWAHLVCLGVEVLISFVQAWRHTSDPTYTLGYSLLFKQLEECASQFAQGCQRSSAAKYSEHECFTLSMCLAQPAYLYAFYLILLEFGRIWWAQLWLHCLWADILICIFMTRGQFEPPEEWQGWIAHLNNEEQEGQEWEEGEEEEEEDAV